MKFKIFLVVFLLFLVPIFAQSHITVYYGLGCPHCAQTIKTLQESDLPFTLETKEVYQDEANREDLFSIYTSFSIPSNIQGVPTTVINIQTVILGSMPDEYWEDLINACNEHHCPQGYFTHKNIVCRIFENFLNP